MKRINLNLYPKDGYIFRERDGTIIRGESWPEVMRKVDQYRRLNKFPIGNVETEVTAQACSRNPSHCAENNAATVHQIKVVSLKGRVLKYMAYLRKLTPKLIPWVDAAAAGRRASICASCPKNTHLPEGCATCRAALAAMRDEVLGVHRTKDHRLNGCVVLGEDLPTSVWVAHDVVDNPELPGNCWRKRGTP